MSLSNPKEEEWLRYKPILWELWGRRGLTTFDVKEQMYKRYGFQASKQSYDRHFKAWDWRKNLTLEECFAVEEIIKKRKRDNGKESEVRLNGIIVHTNHRKKRHKLSWLEEINLREQVTDVLPSELVVQTPPSSETCSLEAKLAKLPWTLFLGVASAQIMQIHPTQTRSLQLDVSSRELLLGTVPSSHIDLSEVAGYLGSILGHTNSEALLSFIYRTAHNRDSVDYNASNWVFNMILDLGAQTSAQVLALIASVTSPIVTEFILILLTHVFQSESSGACNTYMAQILLPRVREFLNAPVRFRGAPYEWMLVNCLWSKPMAELFAAHDGDLMSAWNPFERLLEVHSPDYESLCELLIESGYPDTDGMASIFIMKGKPTLLEMALLKHPNANLSLGMAHAMECDDEDTEQWIIRHVQNRSATCDYQEVLALATCRGFLNTVEKLISRNINLDALVRLPRIEDWGEGRPKLQYEQATAIQFAIDNKNFDIAEHFIRSGASTIKPQGSSLASPLDLAFLTEETQLVRKLLTHGALSERTKNQRTELDLTRWAVSRGDDSFAEELFHSWAAANKTCEAYELDYTIAFSEAIRNDGQILALLLRRNGAYLQTPVPGGSLPESVGRKDLPLSAPLFIIKWSGEVPLSIGVVETDLNSLHSYCANILYCSPLTWAMGNCRPYQHNHEMMRDFISRGADVDPKGTSESTYELALERDCAECLEILLDDTDLAKESIVTAAAMYGKIDLLTQSLSAFRTSWWVSAQSAADQRWIQGPIDHRAVRAALIGAAYRWARVGDGTLFAEILKFEADFSAACMIAALWSICRAFCRPRGVTGDDSKESTKFMEDISKAIGDLLKAGAPFQDCNIEEPLYACCGARKDQIGGGIYSVLVNVMEVVGNSPWCVRSVLLNLLLKYTTTKQKSNVLIGIEELGISIAKAGDVRAMRQLVRAGFDVHQPADKVKKGMTALQAAARRSENLEMVRFLLHEAHVSPSEPAAKRGATSLQAAVFWGGLEMVHELIEAGADVNMIGGSADIYGDSHYKHSTCTALKAAVTTGSLDMVAFLINAGADIGPSGFGARQFEAVVEEAKERNHFAIVQHLEDERRRLHDV